MYRKWSSLFVVVLVLALLMGACSPAPVQEGAGAVATAEPVLANTPQPATAVPETGEEPATPAAVADAFYTWYLDYIGDRSSGEFRNPLVNGAYKDSPYLTARFVAQIDETLANMGQHGGFDPILLAQDIPESIAVQEPSIRGDSATVVVLRTWGGNPDPDPMVVHLVQQGDAWRIDNVTPFEMVPTPPAETLGPAETVDAFYRWYIATVGGDILRTENNPLVDGRYRQSDYLSERFIAGVDEYVATYNPYGYDPIVMSIQMPDQFTVGEATVTGETASVVLQRTWPGLDSWLPMKVILRQENGRWLIDDTTLVVSDIAPAAGGAPAQAVEAFYIWYLAYTGSPAAGEFRNPMVDRAYASSPYLTADFMAAIDTNLAQMRERNMGGSDPFLCAQNIPLSVVVENAYLQPSGQAQVIMHSGFVGPHYLLLTLQPVADTWQIDQVTCASMMPAGVARAFYTWYLGYTGDRTSGDLRNPLVDGAYRDTPFLTGEFVQRVDEIIASFEQGGYDPFLQAQDIPHGFSVIPGPAEDEAIVEFYFTGENNEPYGTWRVLLSFVEDKSHWFINDVQSEGVPALETFANELYGFSFVYPAGWVSEEIDLSGPGLPDDWPVVAAWHVMPADVAAQLAAQTAPDPTAPPIVPPFEVAVVAGDETAVGRAFIPLDEAEIIGVNRTLAYRLRLEPGYSHYVIPHPYRPQVWIVMTDWVTEFPGREAQAEVALPALSMVLNSLQLNQ